MKNKIISFLIIGIITVSLCLFSFAKSSFSKANEVYQVYLNGKKIGLITDKDDLYDLINDRQLEIKEKYGDEFVYLDVMKAPLNKIKNKFRYQIMMRFKLEKADEIEKEIFDCVPKDTKSSVFFEINPNNLS